MNRADYLSSLAEEYGVNVKVVKELSDMLGKEEDFDALITELEYHVETMEENDEDE